MAFYNYSLQNDFPNNAVDFSVLTVEIEASDISTPLVGMSADGGDQVTIEFTADLGPDDKGTLDGLVAAHQGVPFNDSPQRINVIAAQDNSTNVWEEAARLDAEPISTPRYDLKFYCELRTQSGGNNTRSQYRILIDGEEVASGGVQSLGFFDSRSGSLVINTSRGSAPSVVLEWRRAGPADTAQVRRIRLAVVPLVDED